jgi:thiamine pyrophosphokinase
MGATCTIAVVVGGGTIRRIGPEADSVEFDAIIAADSGLDVALAAGLAPTMLVGDLDSISPAGLAWADAHGLVVEAHPADKDDTDTALAVRRALELGATELVLLGGDATDRLDHLLGTLTCLGTPELATCDALSAWFGATLVHVLHPGHQVTLHLAAGATFSLLSLHGACAGVDVRNARWPLTAADLTAGSTLGISNESIGKPVTVAVARGVLTVIVPEAAS